MSEWTQERAAEFRRLAAARTGAEFPAERAQAEAKFNREAPSAALSLLDALKAVPQWIAVTPETMPDVGARVMIFAGPNGASCGVWEGTHWYTVPGNWTVRPSHWMPLPTPPVLP